MRSLIPVMLACLPGFAASTVTPLHPPATTLHYNQPAAHWMTEALPVGNGSLGAMLFGRTDVERIQFNHDTLWTGDEKDTGNYQAFGDVFVQLGHTGVSDYSRELDLDRALFGTTYRAGGAKYSRSAFASHPAGVIVYKFTADRPGAYSGRLWLTDMHDAPVTGERDRLAADGRLGTNGVTYASRLRILHEGGSVRVVTTRPADANAVLANLPEVSRRKLPDTHIVFENCTSITLVLAAGTDYLADRSQSWRGRPPGPASDQRLDAVTAATLPAVFTDHVADYQSLYRRFQLDLGTTSPGQAALPTDERLRAYTTQNTRDPDLEELAVNYGRYLLISSSRPGSMPANLQGLWNDSNNPPWRSDYHSNINVEMNYWPAEPTNLSETHRAFLDYVSSQIPVYRDNTRREPMFSTAKRGWTIRTENGIHGGGSWRWNPPGSAWYARHYWEHYAFSLDKTYLRDIAYPVIKEVVGFWEDFLVERPDGTLVTPKGWSPEHGPEEQGVTYDQQLIHDLFTDYIEAADALGVDKTYRDRVADKRSRLLGSKVGRWGQLQEWETDRDDPQDQHRHVSHLFALHPGRAITANGTPELFAAAKVSLAARGDGGTGWARAWKINFWARLLDGDHAYALIRAFMNHTTSAKTEMNNSGGLYPNLLCAHPPFQIDGNLGYVAGVAEMLVQSQTGEIVLLPALPSAWPTGSVSGLRARGACDVDVQWQDGKLVRAVVTPHAGVIPPVRYGDQILAASDPRLVIGPP